MFNFLHTDSEILVVEHRCLYVFDFGTTPLYLRKASLLKNKTKKKQRTNEWTSSILTANGAAFENTIPWMGTPSSQPDGSLQPWISMGFVLQPHRYSYLLNKCVLNWTEIETSTLLTRTGWEASRENLFPSLPEPDAPSPPPNPYLSIDFTPTRGAGSFPSAPGLFSWLFAFREGMTEGREM